MPSTLKARRGALVKRLGGKCQTCGTRSKLVFDHIKPRKWNPNQQSKEQRLKVYERAAKRGKIQLLCSDCHNAKSAREGSGYDPLARFVKAIFEPEKPF